MSLIALLAQHAPADARPLSSGGGAAGAAVATAAAANAAQVAAERAAAAAKQSAGALARSIDAMRAVQAAQAAARGAAAATGGSVPNGLAVGGLVPDSGLAAGGVANAVTSWTNAKTPTQTTSGDQTVVNVKQTAPQAIMNWSSFNIGRNTSLVYDQQGNANWVALNRVGNSTAPSQILGNIRADGQVYVVNQSGIVFGGTSQINVGSLMASAVNLTDAQFLAGIVKPSVTDFDTRQQIYSIGAPVFSSAPGSAGNVVVEAGAMIQTPAPKSATTGGGYVYLFGGNVSNSGSIVTPNGQSIMAAGHSIYLYQSADSNVRGAEVLVTGTGTAVNTSQGYISAPTGNITMAALTVRQAGALVASTSVDEAGSISLLGRNGATNAPPGGNLNAYASPISLGTVEVASGSITAVVPEQNGYVALDGQAQPQSLIRAEGLTVNVLGGASIVAPSGKVLLAASTSPLQLFQLSHSALVSIQQSSQQDGARVYIGDGAEIDVSGVRGVSVSANADAISIKVLANELRDSPINRGGPLTGESVWVDVNDLKKVSADQVYTAGGLLEVSGWLGLIPRSLDERLTKGGTVSIFSTGDAILRPGAKIDISGGSIIHEAGNVKRTRLIAENGRIYSINDAPADMAYAGICCGFVVDHARWGVKEFYADWRSGERYQDAYIEGKDAGILSVMAYQGELDAIVDATVVNGIYQRGKEKMAKAGTLVIGGQITPTAQNLVIAKSVAVPTDVFANSSVTATTNGSTTTYARDPATLLSADRQTTLYLATDVLDKAGYGTISISATSIYDAATNTYSGGITQTEGATLKVADGGSITLATAGSIVLNDKVAARGGNVTLSTILRTSDGARQDVILNAGAVIDVSGIWTNDFVAGTVLAPTLYNGGTATINAFSNIKLASNSLIDASSGGWVQLSGKLAMANSLPLGTGGNISLITNHTTQGSTSYNSDLTMNGTLRSYGMTAGGQLTFATRDIQIGGQAPAAATTLWLDPSFLSSGGFSQYRLISYRGTTVKADTEIALHSRVIVPDFEKAKAAASGSSLLSIGTVGTPELYQNASPVSLVLSAVDPVDGRLTVEKGSRISTDPGATVSLHASRQLTFDGVVDAPAGTINLDLYGIAQTTLWRTAPGYYAAQSLWIGANARLQAQGLVQNYENSAGRSAYRLWDGGSVRINQQGASADYYPYAAYFGLADNVDQGVALGSVVIAPGAVIDVSGAAGTVTSGAARNNNTEAVATAGGSLSIIATQGLFLDGTLRAQAGGANVAGGTLVIDQQTWAPATRATQTPNYVQQLGRLILTQNDAAMLPNGLAADMPIAAEHAGKMYVSADRIMDAGFDSISLGAAGAVTFNGDIDLHAERNLTINASVISATPGATVRLSSSYFNLGRGKMLEGANSRWKWNFSPRMTLTAGTANLIVNADLIDLDGKMSAGGTYSYSSGGQTVAGALPGFATMTFNSRGDVRLIPQNLDSSAGAKTLFTTLGDINLVAAQVYPVTAAPSSNASTTAPVSLFAIQASGPTSTINIIGNGIVPDVPFSAGGQVQLIAPTINQGGVLRAPFGQITFGDTANADTATTINLLPGSITSVSAEGSLIPYGALRGALDYLYGYARQPSVPAMNDPIALVAPPEKIISFYGKTINIAGAANGKAAARIDESGGGDMYAFQFVSGSGGSVDTLNGVNTFAILPSLGKGYAPISTVMASSNGDPSILAANVNLKVGDQVYLSGIDGLAAGNYTLLPGHYALLPGGYKITVSATGQMASQLGTNLQLANGAYRVSGYRGVANTTVRDSLYSQFIVTPGSVVRRQSQYLETTASDFFAAQAERLGTTVPRIAADAGRLVFNIRNTIKFAGDADFTPGVGGRGGQVDIFADKIAIIGAGDTVQAGYIGLDSGLIGALKAESVLIGGIRTLSTATNQLQMLQSATDVKIGAHALLQAPEVMLRATNSIVLNAGAVIDTTSSAMASDVFPIDSKTGQSIGSIALTDGAFLMASNVAAVVPVLLTGSGNSSVVIGGGARVSAKSSVTLGTVQDITLDPNAAIGAPTVMLTAPVINLGQGNSTGLTLTSELIRVLTAGDPAHNVAAAANIVLTAAQSINVYGSVDLGRASSSSASMFTINAPVIQGFGSASDKATLTAGRLTLSNRGAATNAVGMGSGSFAINASELIIGTGTIGFAGFSTVALSATDRLLGEGVGTVTVPGNLVVTAPLVTGKAGADTNFNAVGAVTFQASPSAAASVLEPRSVGAHLTVNAASIAQNGRIVMPSGAVTLNGRNGVSLGAGSMIDLSGAEVAFFDIVRITPAGTVNLQSANGNVAMAAGATIDLSGGDLADYRAGYSGYLDTVSSDIGSKAGTLNIQAANGQALLNGTLKATPGTGHDGGAIAINVGSGDAAALLAIMQPFTGSQALALQSGDIVVGNVAARNVDFSAATGNLLVSGTIDASGSNGGAIRLSAGRNLTLASGALLDAHATSEAGKAGNVFLGIAGNSTGLIVLGAGTSIDLSAGSKNTDVSNGKLWLRAPRLGSSDVALRDQGVSIRGAREIALEAVKVYDVTGNAYVDQWIGTTVSDAANYMTNAAAIRSAIGAIGNHGLAHLMPGIELSSSADLALLLAPTRTNTGIDLHQYRFSNEPMVLTLRAAGNIRMNGSLSDGFEAPVNTPDGNIFATAAQLTSGRSATLRLVSGAHAAGADPLAVTPVGTLASGSGSVLFDDPHKDTGNYPIASVLRTGTGNIELAAGRDITLTTPFGIYSAGVNATDTYGPGVFTVPTLWYTNLPAAYGVRTNDYFNYPVSGGQVKVSAQGSLTSAQITLPNGSGTAYAGSELAAYWLWTERTLVGTPQAYRGLYPTWFVNFGIYYKNFYSGTTSATSVAAFQGIGAFGGGDASVRVGGNITNVDIAVPTTGKLPNDPTVGPYTDQATYLSGMKVYGGGDMSVLAGGAINNANLTVGKGSADIRGGDIGSVLRVNLQVGDAQLEAYSDGNMNVILGDPTRAVQQWRYDKALWPGYFDGSMSPSRTSPPPGLMGTTRKGSGTSSGQAPGSGKTNGDWTTQPSSYEFGVFSTQTSASAFDLQAAGDVTLSGDFAPGNLDFVATNGSILAGTLSAGISNGYGGVVLARPGTTGQIDFLAGNSITAGFSTTTSVPLVVSYNVAATMLNFIDTISTAAPVLPLPADDNTDHLYAVTGDLKRIQLSVTKQSAIRAGRDIVAPLFYLQNNRDTDVSVISAGRDISDVLSRSNGTRNSFFNIDMAGPGMLAVEAGRDLMVEGALVSTPATPLGIASIGNTANNLLPAKGASISIMAGTGKKGPDIAGFIAAYLDPANRAGVLKTYGSELTAYMRDRQRNVNLSDVEARTLFLRLSPDQQRAFVETVYFAELKAGGSAAAAGEGAGGKGYERAYRAIATLFPTSDAAGKPINYQGNIALYGLARVRTEAGGSINMLAPGGGVTLGFENDTPNLSGQKDTARPGVVTLQGGDVNMFTEGDVVVAQSRVFTELGGDILMFSTDGDLNAGKGKRTSLVTSPPKFTTSPWGVVSKSVATPTTGAGIATLIGVPGVPPGNVYLFAPRGTIDAGEAGIRVSGNVILQALQVLNANNIQVQGSSIGLPSSPPAPVAALTSANNTAGALRPETPAPGASERPSVIIVEVLGYGGGDSDELKRDRARPDERAAIDRYDPTSAIHVAGNGKLTERQSASLTDEEKKRLGELMAHARD